jgi:hypothetical protein
LLESSSVRVLEARFRFDAAEDAEPITVAHVVWADARDPRPVVQPSFSLQRHSAPATVLVKLQYLVEMTAPDSFARLQALPSRFWSFVEVSDHPQVPAKGD